MALSPSETRIDLNTASVRQLTQLPGVSKTVAYAIVNHRQRHGFLTSWEEFKEIKGFPAQRLREIKTRATLTCPDPEFAPPRHPAAHLRAAVKKTAAQTRRLRSTRRAQRGDDPAEHRPH